MSTLPLLVFRRRGTLDFLHSLLVQAAAISSAMIAGIFYAFSSFVVAALQRLPSASGVDAMNEINAIASTPAFMWFLMGTSVLCGALTLWSVVSIDRLEGQLVAVAGLLFLFGVMGVTAAFNVPLNNHLANFTSADGASFWYVFTRDWTVWNDVRTVCAGLSAALYGIGLTRSGDGR